MPKVSFVLPAYKRRFLKEAIASILAQTYRDFELVVVDDCSSENLKEVVDEFHDERLTYHRNEKNLGETDLVAAWNHAMTYATGEWCVLASDDDVHHKEYLAEMVRLSEKYPQVDVFHCRIAIINSSGEITRVGAPRAEYESPVQMIYHTAIRRIDQRMADLFFRRRIYERKGGFFWSPTAWYSDLGSAILFSQENGAVCSDRILFFFRESGENITTASCGLAQKIEAGVQFREWFCSHLKRLPLRNDDDRLLLPECERRLDDQIINAIRFVLRNTSFLSYFRLVKESRLCKAEKRALLKERIRPFLYIMNWAPTRWFKHAR